MKNHLLDKQISEMYERHIGTVYRVCFLYMKKSSCDLEDAVQNTFIKLIRSGKEFSSGEHEKAWLIVTAGNVCKNMLKTAWKRRVTLVKDFEATQDMQFAPDETLQCVLALPDKYKTAIYLHYYEGYTGSEIAKILGKKESTVWSYLHRGRKMLSEIIREEQCND